ncbi:hypothetical protein V1505DRAFT_376625 [Lipomyces doorenjongii]
MSLSTSYPEVVNTSYAEVAASEPLPEKSISLNGDKLPARNKRHEVHGTSEGQPTVSRSMFGLSRLTFGLVIVGFLAGSTIIMGVGLGVGLKPKSPIPSPPTSTVISSTFSTSPAASALKTEFSSSTSSSALSATAKSIAPNTIFSAVSTFTTEFRSSTSSALSATSKSTDPTTTSSDIASLSAGISNTPSSSTSTRFTSSATTIKSTSYIEQMTTSSYASAPTIEVGLSVFFNVQSINSEVDGRSIGWGYSTNPSLDPVYITAHCWGFDSDGSAIYSGFSTDGTTGFNMNHAYLQVQDNWVIFSSEINNSSLVQVVEGNQYLAFNGSSTSFYAIYSTAAEGYLNTWGNNITAWQVVYYSDSPPSGVEPILISISQDTCSGNAIV